MKRSILSLLLLLSAAQIAQGQGGVLALRSIDFTDAFRDLKCTRITSNSSTWSESTANANVLKINEWMDKTAASGKQSVLYLSNGYIAINGTLGKKPGSIVGLPSGVHIICAGGLANGSYRPTRNDVNTRTAGFMWVGNTSTPMIRIREHGNVIYGNFYGYPYTSGDTTPTVPRCRAAIEFEQAASGWTAGKAKIEGTFTGFDKAIRLEGTAHCDHIEFPRLMVRDCPTGIYNTCLQSIFHRVGMVDFYCAKSVQNVVFDYQDGGSLKVDAVSVTGNEAGVYGCTLLRTNNNSANNGGFVIDGLKVDRSFLSRMQEQSSGGGYWRLHEHQSNGAFAVWIRGHMAFSSADISVANWHNGSGDAVIQHALAGSVRRRMAVDVWGLDTTNAADFKDYVFPTP